VSPGCVFTEINIDWHAPRNPGEGMTRPAPLCNTGAYMVFRDMHGRHDFVQHDTALQTRCYSGPDYHIRLWSDHKHQEQTGDAHGRQDQWVAGGIHHERRAKNHHHHIDMDWDAVRFHMVKSLASDCHSRRWKVHPGAVDTFQKFDNTGVVARITVQREGDFPQCPAGTN
jgi:hypothetical protein